MPQDQEQKREQINDSIRVREAYAWSKTEMSRRLRVDYKTIQRRQSKDKKGEWKQELGGESTVFHELMLALKQIGAGWIVDKVTSGDWSMDSLLQEKRERGGGVVLEVERVILVLDEVLKQLNHMPAPDQFKRYNSKQRLKEAILSLRDEMADIRAMDEDERAALGASDNGQAPPQEPPDE